MESKKSTKIALPLKAGMVLVNESSGANILTISVTTFSVVDLDAQTLRGTLHVEFVIQEFFKKEGTGFPNIRVFHFKLYIANCGLAVDDIKWNSLPKTINTIHAWGDKFTKDDEGVPDEWREWVETKPNRYMY